MNCDYTVLEIEKELEALRRNSSKQINEIFVLTEILGCENENTGIKILRVVKLIENVFADGLEAETLLVALNLHPKYRHVADIGDRRGLFYVENLSHKELANPVSALHKRENKLIKRLAAHIIRVIEHADTKEDVIKVLLESRGRAAPESSDEPVSSTAVKIITASRPLQPSGFFIGREQKLADIKKELVGNAMMKLFHTILTLCGCSKNSTVPIITPR